LEVVKPESTDIPCHQGQELVGLVPAKVRPREQFKKVFLSRYSKEGVVANRCFAAVAPKRFDVH
jgi:hypothetical protein